MATVQGEGNAVHCVWLPFARKGTLGLILSRYVEDTLEHNHKFDAKSIIIADISREGRLKYWNNELCTKHPLTFDFAVTVLHTKSPFQILANASQARRRWHPPLCQLALPENRTSRPVVLPRLSRLPYQIRLLRLSRNVNHGFQRWCYRQLTSTL